MENENMNSQNQETEQEQQGQGAEQGQQEEKTFTQAEVDAIINKRLAKERKGQPTAEELSAYREWKKSQQSPDERQAATQAERDSALVEVEMTRRENYLLRQGLWHKLGEIFAVLVAALCDVALSVIVKGAGITLPIDIGPLVTPVVILWYIITELGSVAENADKLGAPVPAWLKKSLKQYKDKIDNAQGGGDEEEDKPPDDTEDHGKHEKQTEEHKESLARSAALPIKRGSKSKTGPQ